MGNHKTSTLRLCGVAGGDQKFGTSLKFNSSTMENDGWKTILSFWIPATFQGRAVKLQVGIISGKHGQLDVVFPVIVFENTSVKNGPTNRTGACNSTNKIK